MQYTWSERKAKLNLKRHGVSFQEAAEALESDAQAIVDADADHDHEQRLRATAWSPRGRFLFIVIVERDADTTRIISARKATASEEADYADQIRP